MHEEHTLAGERAPPQHEFSWKTVEATLQLECSCDARLFRIQRPDGDGELVAICAGCGTAHALSIPAS